MAMRRSALGRQGGMLSPAAASRGAQSAMKAVNPPVALMYRAGEAIGASGWFLAAGRAGGAKAAQLRAPSVGGHGRHGVAAFGPVLRQAQRRDQLTRLTERKVETADPGRGSVQQLFEAGEVVVRLQSVQRQPVVLQLSLIHI